MENDEAKLRDGSEWVDHEDCLIGNEAGLKSLINACEIALKEGEYFGSDLDEYVGVKKIESDWFKDPQDSQSTRLTQFGLGIFLSTLLALILIGLVTVAKWVF